MTRHDALALPRCSAYPHTLTPPGTIVTLSNAEGTFVILSGFVTRQSGKPRNVYFLHDEAGELRQAINGWEVVSVWASDRLAELEAGTLELLDLRGALRRAVGEL